MKHSAASFANVISTLLLLVAASTAVNFAHAEVVDREDHGDEKKHLRRELQKDVWSER